MITDVDLLWNSLLKLKNDTETNEDQISSFCVFYTANSFEIKMNYHPAISDTSFLYISFNGFGGNGKYTDSCTVDIDKDGLLTMHENTLFGIKAFRMLQIYLPFCFYRILARKMNKAVAVAHFAQSLDGKIATNTGNSRWISCHENLIHAHRMRALCKGILIGMNTLLRDKPSLTVRHVEGENPVKIVVGSSNADFSSLNAVEDKVVVITNGDLALGKHIQVIKIASENGIMDPNEILRLIYKELDICSVYVEGGAYTSSNFLINRALQQIQIYLGPLIFGSGISNFTFPMINDVAESVKFNEHHFIPMGEGVLFYGTPQ